MERSLLQSALFHILYKELVNVTGGHWLGLLQIFTQCHVVCYTILIINFGFVCGPCIIIGVIYSWYRSVGGRRRWIDNVPVRHVCHLSFLTGRLVTSPATRARLLSCHDTDHGYGHNRLCVPLV